MRFAANQEFHLDRLGSLKSIFAFKQPIERYRVRRPMRSDLGLQATGQYRES
jgi:hypothetical protein